jgi:hypothetical protein
MFITQQCIPETGDGYNPDFFDAMLAHELDEFWLNGINLSNDTFFVYLMF